MLRRGQAVNDQNHIYLGKLCKTRGEKRSELARKEEESWFKAQ
jgi:hypothetical protein